MSETLPATRIIEVRFEIMLPIAATMDQIDEWVQFELGCGTLQEDSNPLSSYDLESIDAPMLQDMGCHFREERILIREDGGTKHYRVRRFRDAEPALPHPMRQK